MTKQQGHRPTAKIYVFPARPRAASGTPHTSYPRPQTAQVSPVVYGGAWYHQAAIEEEVQHHVRPFPYKRH